jgi:large subunit ribosomal protein L20
MVRVHTGVAHHKRVKKLLKRAKGFRGQRSKNLRSAKHTLLRAGAFAYAHRRLRKRDMRALWIIRITAAVRAEGMNYSSFMGAIKKAGITLDRKALSELAAREPETFSKLVAQVKAQVKQPAAA